MEETWQKDRAQQIRVENQPLERAGTRVSIRHPDRWIALLVALVSFALAVTMTHPAPGSWNDISRVAAIQARVEQGTWTLDNSPWLNETEDVVLLNDQLFSGKMPLLSGIGALVYAALHSAAGLSLAPDCGETGAGCAYYWLTLTLVGLPFALMLGLVYLWARSLKFSIWVALLGTVALGLGTQAFPYSLVLNHHVPAAVALFVGLYSLTVLAPRSARWLLLTGFAAAFAALCDPLAGAFGVGLFGVAVYRYRRGAVYFVLGALPPVLLTTWLDLQITGTILPPYVIPQAYMDREAGAERGLAGAGTPDDLPQYAFKMYLGAQGLFAYNPILLFALLGIAIVAFTRRAALRPEAIAVGLSALVMGVYVAFRTGNLGGEGYGERYFISMVPVVMAFLFFAPPLFKTRGRAIFALLFAVALGLSVFSSYQGAHRPWDYVQPPFQLTRDSKTGAIGARWNVR